MRNMMNIEQVSQIKSKLELYTSSEEITFNEISTILEEINYHYKTNNTHKLEALENDLRTKCQKIKTNHSSDKLILEKNIQGYYETALKVNQIFNNIDTGSV